MFQKGEPVSDAEELLTFKVYRKFKYLDLGQRHECHLDVEGRANSENLARNVEEVLQLIVPKFLNRDPSRRLNVEFRDRLD